MRTRLTTLTDFREAVNLLEHKSLSEAVRIASKIPQGVERAVLWIGIAHSYGEKADLVNTHAALNEAVVGARSVDDFRRAVLTLAAAVEMNTVDPALAQIMLSEAMKEFNRADLKPMRLGQLIEQVKVGVIWRDFPLRINNVEFGLVAGISTFSSVDLEGTLVAVESLRDEANRAEALLSIAAIVLKSPRPAVSGQSQ